jgi:DNA-binding IclR family transcriptional regulator
MSQNLYNVPAVEQAVRVMFCLADNGSSPRSLTDICRDVGIHRSKAFSILNTLNEHGIVKKNPNRKGYVLGPGLLTLTGKMLATLNLPRLAEPILSELARKVGATVSLGIISDNKTYIIAEYLGSPSIGVSSPIGYVTPITYGAHGKAIAAFLPENELERLLKNKDLMFYGRVEKYDEKRLRINAVAAALLDQNSYPIGYVTVVGFFTREAALKIGPLAVGAVKTISKEAGHMIFWQKDSQRKNLA